MQTPDNINQSNDPSQNPAAVDLEHPPVAPTLEEVQKAGYSPEAAALIVRKQNAGVAAWVNTQGDLAAKNAAAGKAVLDEQDKIDAEEKENDAKKKALAADLQKKADDAKTKAGTITPVRPTPVKQDDIPYPELVVGRKLDAKRLIVDFDEFTKLQHACIQNKTQAWSGHAGLVSFGRLVGKVDRAGNVITTDAQAWYEEVKKNISKLFK
jgi:hypothetical protein